MAMNIALETPTFRCQVFIGTALAVLIDRIILSIDDFRHGEHGSFSESLKIAAMEKTIASFGALGLGVSVWLIKSKRLSITRSSPFFIKLNFSSRARKAIRFQVDAAAKGAPLGGIAVLPSQYPKVGTHVR
jgi:hypothetical protein